MIGADVCLERSNGARRLPPSVARSSAELDLLAATPIAVEDVHILVPTSAEHAACYFIAKKKVVEPVVAALRNAGADVTAVSVQRGDASVSVDAVSVADIWPASRSERLAQEIGGYALAAVVLLAVATYGHAYARFWRAGLELDERIAGAQLEAKAARAVLQTRQAELATIAKVRAEKNTAVPLLSVWSEMTSRLPDDAFLSDLDVSGDTVSITGFARSASSLVAGIDASPLFETPTFTGPVVRTPGHDGERFTLTAGVSRP